MRAAALFRAASLVLAATAASPAAAQPVVTSAAPQRIALTVYRAPGGNGAIDLRFLGGFALVTETRRVALPRGAAVLRFEGVAEGIVPVSAVVDGLPGGVVEKNRDARLLSPASLVDGSLGRQVTLTRTNRATGRKTSEEATIVAGPTPGVVLRTATGIETLRCSGLPEGLSYGGVPAGLSSKPVLSIATVSPVARTVTVRLSYLASGFDWRASYVATLAADQRSLDLFAWLTLANGNAGIFPNAEVAAVAGRLNRIYTPSLRAAVGALSLTCYPLGTTTSNLRKREFEPAEEIIVTGGRVMAAPAFGPPPPPPPAPPPPPPPEDLGDLKLYRVPERVTVAARGQKQVALLARSAVPFERRYRRQLYPGQTMPPSPTVAVLVLRNRAEAGLGLALPSGSTATYARRGDERLLLGLGALDDRAEGETFRLSAGTSTQILVGQTQISQHETLITASNASRLPARLEVPIGQAGQKIESDDPTLEIIDGIATWSILIEPNSRAELRIRY
ncbi:DUF4139 domain-containing protein [Sphingomonas qomolangmaensis]|uniref:DUF4139 domain-containing protein n=1 Tax=Sphingomonas qomolangmaensis TaxID=2918765 RepID=A0ABY5LE22_9SPHN|nr:hypothetical protein [Sphingomonas qomolangmaensis]UUL84034.1 hypothetical protein NMP03_07555 [Sphingomonas qomolangmaensis]